MRLASGENSALSQPLQPSRLISRRVPFASTRSGVATPLSTVTRSTLCVPAAGITQTTGSALLGASVISPSRATACQHPTHGVPVSYTHLRAHETPEHLV